MKTPRLVVVSGINSNLKRPLLFVEYAMLDDIDRDRIDNFLVSTETNTDYWSLSGGVMRESGIAEDCIVTGSKKTIERIKDSFGI